MIFGSNLRTPRARGGIGKAAGAAEYGYIEEISEHPRARRKRGKKKAGNFRENGNSNCRPCGISIYRDHGISVFHCPRIQFTISKRLEARRGRSALASE